MSPRRRVMDEGQEAMRWFLVENQPVIRAQVGPLISQLFKKLSEVDKELKQDVLLEFCDKVRYEIAEFCSRSMGLDAVEVLVALEELHMFPYLEIDLGGAYGSES